MSVVCCRGVTLVRQWFDSSNNSNAYRPLATDETRQSQRSNNAVDDNVNQSSAVTSPTSPRRRRGKSPTSQVPALQTIPEERPEDSTDDPSNANVNNSLLFAAAFSFSNSNNANNSAGSSLPVHLQDAGFITPLPSPPPPSVRRQQWPGQVNISPSVVNIDEDGFETVDLFTAAV